MRRVAIHGTRFAVVAVASCLLSAWAWSLPALADEPDWREIARRYAPIVYLDGAEQYFPSSFEFAFPNFVRKKTGERYWLSTREEVPSPSSVLAFFHGEKDAITSGRGVPAYAFINRPAAAEGGVDVVYYFYFPYNRGKNVCIGLEVNGNCIGGRTMVDNHISDWNEASIRFNADGRPWYLHVSAHEFGAVYRFSDGHFVQWDPGSPGRAQSVMRGATLQFETTAAVRRPILYAAWGSHGLYVKPGKHGYRKLGTGETLVDYTSKGHRWDTGQKLAVYDFADRTGWPSWTQDSRQDCVRSGCDPSDPWSGGIYRWGNAKQGCNVPKTSECRLNDGPAGPVDKDWTGKQFAGLRIPDPSMYITEVRVIKGNLRCPSGFEALRYGAVTRANGGAPAAADVNRGMGGDNVGICVRYTAADAVRASNTRVLTDIRVAHWPNWRAACPAGWNQVGRLTTGTRGPCDREGLCAQFSALGELNEVSRRPLYSVGLTSLDAGILMDPPLCPANAPITRGENIQTRKTGCGGSLLFVCSD